MKVCTIGCLGLGTCARVCPFNAITMGPQGLPVVDEKKCTGCGTCERVCPKHIINLSSITRRIIREYTTEECTTPCQRGCPAGIDIREYIRQISLGNYHRAVQVIKERNPFPAVIGRICPRPCELECRRNFIDEPVAINFLKRYAADYEKQSGERILPYKAPPTGRKIAVVGGGVEGMSTAFFAARLGHEVSVFEATPKLGGLLRSAIAADRLPEDILNWDIDGIFEMGVHAETGKALGNDFTVDSLLSREFDAVFIASGGWDSRLARGAVDEVESPIPGTYLLVDIIRFGAAKPEKFSGLSNVVISGGGKLALQAAKMCKDLGAESITILFRESLEKSPVVDDDIKDLGIDGLHIVYDAAITRLFGEENQLKEIEYTNFDSLEKTTLAANSVILASGRFPELIFIPPSPPASEPETTPESTTEVLPATLPGWEAVLPYKQPMLKDEIGMFAQGDVLADYSAAIKAIGAGRRAAASIHQLMYGIEPSLTEDVIAPNSTIQDVDHVEDVNSSQRQIMPICSGKELAVCGEIERGFSEEMALKEAERCLQCGLICYERSVQIEDSAEEAEAVSN